MSKQELHRGAILLQAEIWNNSSGYVSDVCLYKELWEVIGMALVP